MFNFFLYWFNLPFVLALLCGLLLMLAQILGGSGDHDSDVDADVDADVDVDADIDADGDFMGDMLSVLGVGRVPLMLVIMALLLTFGSLGLLFNALARFTFDLTSYPNWVFLVVLLLTTLLTVPLAGRLSRAVGNLAQDSTTAVSFEQLVGRLGVVVSTSVSPTYGRVQVRDTHGFIHTVYAISENTAIIPEHSEVALLSYDTGRRCFIVQPMGRLSV